VICVLILFCVLFPPMYIIVYFLFVYSVNDHCRRVKTLLQLIHITLYIIISYIISYTISHHFISVTGHNPATGELIAHHRTHELPYNDPSTVRSPKWPVASSFTPQKFCPTISSLITSSFSDGIESASRNIRKYILKIHNSFNKIN
jgi:hypothetical protein